MNDDQPPTNHTNQESTDQDYGQDQPSTDQATTPDLIPLKAAAEVLGISVNAVRQRLKRGTIAGVKTDAGWLVDPTTTSADPVSNQPSTDHTTTTHDQPTNQDPTVDLAPLADLIERQSRELQELRETATVWQFRARQAEEQLKQLTAGGDDHHEAVESPESAASPEHGSTVEGDADRGSESVWDRIRGWFR